MSKPEAERLSWRESVAAQLYEIADSWSRGDIESAKDLSEELRRVQTRCSAREGLLNSAYGDREAAWR